MKPRLKLICVLAGIAFLAILARYATRERQAVKGLVWLNPVELAEEIRPGPFTTLKFRLLRALPGTFWRWYMSGREQLLIETRLLALTPEAAHRAEPSSLCLTNDDGVRAWILSAEELKGLKQQLKALPEVSLVHSLRLTTYDGGQAQLSDGSPSTTTTNSSFIGLTVDLLPKVTGNSISLLVGATSTAGDPLPDGKMMVVSTNLMTACRVLLPNSGGLLVKDNSAMDSHGTNYWLIISPAAVDARGVPKKL